MHDELPRIPGLQQRWGDGVFLCPYCHAHETRGRPIGVIATSPTSPQQAIIASDWGPATYFTQGVLEPDERSLGMLKARGVVVERVPVVELLGPASAVTAVRLGDGRSVELAAALIATRPEMASPLADRLGCLIEENAHGPTVRVDDSGLTTVTGVYAAGDIANPLHNISRAVASGVTAGIGAHRALVFDEVTREVDKCGHSRCARQTVRLQA